MNELQAYSIHRSVAKQISQMFPIDEIVLARVAFSVNRKESNFNEKAKNKNSSARGMMQMLEGTQKEIETKYLRKDYEPERIWNPEYAIYLGQYELARQIMRYKGDVRKGVHAYNRGSYLPKNKKSFTSGELYTNSVFAHHARTNYEELENNLRVVIASTQQTTGKRSYTWG